MPDEGARTDGAEVALGAFSVVTQSTLVGPLLYKSVFLGEWLQAVMRHHPEPSVRDALALMSRETLVEAIGLMTAMRAWDSRPPDDEVVERVVRSMQRQLLHDLLALKEGSNEVIVQLAMVAPTQELRGELLHLADLDRKHADALRVLLGAVASDELVSRRALGPDTPPQGQGVREDRPRERTLSATLKGDLRALQERGVLPARLILSPIALRHLRDEGVVGEDGTVLNLPADVDFGWSGECYAVVTDERVRLAELLSMTEAPEPAVSDAL